MTVRTDLERAIAMAEASKGSYLLFATASEDQNTTSVFKDMASDMQRHVKILESRRDYLDTNNPLNEGEGKGKDQEKEKENKKDAGEKN